MCHNILREEDDDIPASDSVTSANTATGTNEADATEQNGNISAKMATLSLDDKNKDETTTTINGNVAAPEATNAADNPKPEVTVAAKKKGKKGGAVNNNNNNNNAADSADAKEVSATVDNVENHKKTSSPADELINDENSATVQV